MSDGRFRSFGRRRGVGSGQISRRSRNSREESAPAPRPSDWVRHQALSGGRPLIQDFLQFEGRVDKGTGIVALLCKAILLRDEDVDGQDELFAYLPADGVASFGLVVQELEDDEEIDVAEGAGVAAGVAADEDDLFRVEPFGDQLRNSLNCRPVD